MREFRRCGSGVRLRLHFLIVIFFSSKFLRWSGSLCVLSYVVSFFVRCDLRFEISYGDPLLLALPRRPPFRALEVRAVGKAEGEQIYVTRRKRS